MLSPKITEILATFFYLGKSPKAPGTVGTLGAIPLLLVMSYLKPIAFLVVSYALVLVAIWVSQLYEKTAKVHDSSEIVIDEVVGFLVAMALVPLNLKSLLVGFLLFRFFDIVKPFPISYVDKKIKGGIGVVADDVLAGIIVNVLMHIILIKTTWLV